MTDYNKLTVANLRSLLKERGIASTGLTRKQQIVERLTAADAAIAATVPNVETGDEATAPAPAAAEVVGSQDAQSTEPTQADSLPRDGEAQVPEPEASQHVEQNPRASPGEDAHAEQPFSTTSSVTLPAEDSERLSTPVVVAASTSQTPVPSREAPLETSTGAPSTEGEPIGQASLPDSSRLNSEDVSEDRRKRKRRSQTPPVDSTEAAFKKSRIDEASDVRSNEEETSMAMTTGGKSEGGLPESSAREEVRKSEQIPLAPGEAKSRPEDSLHAQGDSSENLPQTSSLAQHSFQPSEEVGEGIPAGQEQTLQEQTTDLVQPLPGSSESAPTEEPSLAIKPSSPESTPRASQPQKGNRYKDLFGSTSDPARTVSDPSSKLPPDDDERDIEPALHSATAALYIRDFMRPLQPTSVRDHLIELAAPPGQAPSADVLLDFHLDAIRTHCFARFSNVSAASRVRSALHNRVWPDERTRKPLWADFVPEERVSEWIEAEQNSGSGRPSGNRRWQVVYEDNSNGGMQAIFQEVGKGGSDFGRGHAQASVGAGLGVPNAPSGPRLGLQPRVQRDAREKTDGDRPSAPGSKPKPTTESFMALDSLFKSTTTKPKLYFLPVSKTLADRRLAELDRSTKRGYSLKDVGRWEEFHKYTFDEEDLLVDCGPMRPSPRDAAPRGRGRPGGYGGYAPHPTRGGWRGRYD